MMADGFNDDFTRRVVMDATAMDWQASPSPSVWRKRVARFRCLLPNPCKQTQG